MSKTPPRPSPQSPSPRPSPEGEGVNTEKANLFSPSGETERGALTANFTLEEMTRSQVATARGIDNRPKACHVGNLRSLCTHVLQPLREAWGGPIRVTSGYRSPKLNKAVGGARNSQHLLGQAADIKASLPPAPLSDGERGVDGNDLREANKRLFQLIIDLRLPFDQLIDERDYAWIHVSYSPRHRRQVLHLK